MALAAAPDIPGPFGEPGYRPRVLVVDDESVVRDVVVRYLRHDGFDTLEAADGVTARRSIEADRPDLVVLDVMLPECNGLDLCRWIRSERGPPGYPAHGSGRGVRPHHRARTGSRRLRRQAVFAAGAGGPDQVDPPACCVRRRSRTVRHIEAGGLSIDADRREVLLGGSDVGLTATEFDLLWCLASHPRVAFSREQLLAQVWGYEAALDAGTATVTVHVRRLREKIEDDPSDPRRLSTVWGFGYRFTP